MRNSLPMNPMMFKAAVLITCLLLAMVYNKSKAQGKTETVQTRATVVAIR